MCRPAVVLLRLRWWLSRSASWAHPEADTDVGAETASKSGCIALTENRFTQSSNTPGPRVEHTPEPLGRPGRQSGSPAIRGRSRQFAASELQTAPGAKNQPGDGQKARGQRLQAREARPRSCTGSMKPQNVRKSWPSGLSNPIAAPVNRRHTPLCQWFRGRLATCAKGRRGRVPSPPLHVRHQDTSGGLSAPIGGQYGP